MYSWSIFKMSTYKGSIMGTIHVDFCPLYQVKGIGRKCPLDFGSCCPWMKSGFDLKQLSVNLACVLYMSVFRASAGWYGWRVHKPWGDPWICEDFQDPPALAGPHTDAGGPGTHGHRGSRLQPVCHLQVSSHTQNERKDRRRDDVSPASEVATLEPLSHIVPGKLLG